MSCIFEAFEHALGFLAQAGSQEELFWHVRLGRLSRGSQCMFRGTWAHAILDAYEQTEDEVQFELDRQADAYGQTEEEDDAYDAATPTD